MLGPNVGESVGLPDSPIVGELVGINVGKGVGCLVGLSLGKAVEVSSGVVGIWLGSRLEIVSEGC